MVATGNNRNHAELRKKPRRHFDYNAKIQKDKDSPAFACAISDISDTGARLNLKEDVELPEAFFLLLTPNGATHRHCRVIWRDGLTLGVKFLDPR
jgi:PilZ domain